MQKDEGLAKAAAIFAIVAALATLLAVSVDPPAMGKQRSTRRSEAKVQGIPVPAATPQGGVGVAQERGTAVPGWEAGGRRAPSNSRGTQE